MWYLYVIFGLCILLSAFFSSSETAYSLVNKLRLKKEAEKGNRRAKLALNNVEKFDQTVSTILLGNNLVNIAASSLGTIIALFLFKGKLNDNLATTLGSIIVFIVLLVFGEIVPKVVSMRYNYSWSKGYAWIIKGLRIIFFPIVWPVNKLCDGIFKIKKKIQHSDEDVNEEVTDDELLEMVDAIEDEGLIDEDQSDLLKSAIDFTDITANEIMIPRVDVFGFDIEDSITELKEDNEIFSHSRIPVYKENLDNVIGVLNTIDLLRAINNGVENIDLMSMLEVPYYVPESKQISSILQDIKVSHHHLAIVKDEYGGTAGILTLEDILEELVGDIWDETDEVEEEFTKQSENTYLVDGGMNIEDFLELVGLEPDEIDTDCTTVSGWCIEELERFAKVGDTFDFKNLTIFILEADEFTVQKIKVIVNEIDEE